MTNETVKVARKLFKKAIAQLSEDELFQWLCFVYGLMELKMTEDDLKIMEEQLDIIRRIKRI